MNTFPSHNSSGGEVAGCTAFKESSIAGLAFLGSQFEDLEGLSGRVSALAVFVRSQVERRPDQVTVAQAAAYLRVVNMARLAFSERVFERRQELASTLNTAIDLARREWGIGMHPA